MSNNPPKELAGFVPFRDESFTVLLPNGLELENRLDAVRFGREDITRDLAGLELARRSLSRTREPVASAALSLIVAHLESLEGLPERVERRAPRTVRNPFR